jgi:hypothetical protein
MHVFLDAAAFGLVYAVIAAAAAAIMVAFPPGPAGVDQRARNAARASAFAAENAAKTLKTDQIG